MDLGFRSLTRRTSLRIGAIGSLGLTTSRWLKANEAAGTERRIRSCILVFFYGGPSHVDTWDMKPNAPEEVRGTFKPIQTSAPGMVCCDHLPRLARVMDRVCIVRSMHHAMTNHNAAAVEALCGRTPARGDLELLADDELSFPCYGAVMERMVRSPNQELTAVALPHVMRNIVRLPGQNAGLLGSAYNPFQLEIDPMSEDIEVGVIDLPADISLHRLGDRQDLLKRVDDHTDHIRASSMEAYHQRAFNLLRSDRVKRSLAIGTESASVRDRYGRHRLGQSLLLARRLVESDVPFVTVYDGVNNGQEANWDSHLSVFPRMTDHLLPPADQGLSALIEDLDARGLLDSTLVIAMGEFGRTPKVNSSAGRDHWPHCYSVLLAGGGVKGGTTHGSSDRYGAYPDSDPVTPGDLAATLFWRMGIDPRTEVHDKVGRPFALSTGQPLQTIFA